MSSMGLNRTASREQVIQGRQSTYILFLLLTIFPSLIWGQSGQRIKPISARQSSLGNQLGEAGNAIDGNTNGRWRFSKFTKNSVTHTGQENNPWWEVDLGDIYEINKVEIWRGSSCCPEVYDNLNI